MLCNTLGIVIKTIDYNDKYLLTQIYTRDFGNVTYMVSKSKSKNAKVKRVIFQPLSVLNLVVKHQNNKDIQHINEAQIEDYHHSIQTDIRKTSLVFFISDFLSKILKEPHKDEHLFDFLRNSLQFLECNPNNIANYHLVFLLKLSSFLGFCPNFTTYKKNSLFDMLNGEFTTLRPIHNKYFTREDSFSIYLLGRMSFSNMHLFKYNKKQRNDIISKMIEYYKIHTNDFSDLKTLSILQDIF